MNCPRCGNTNVKENSACDLCGWTPSGDVAGSSDAIDKMYEAVKQRMSDEASAAINDAALDQVLASGPDIDDIDLSAALAPDEPAKQEESKSILHHDEEMSDEQMQAFLSGVAIDLVPGDGKSVPPELAAKIMAQSTATAEKLAPKAEKYDSIDDIFTATGADDFSSFMPDFDESALPEPDPKEEKEETPDVQLKKRSPIPIIIGIAVSIIGSAILTTLALAFIFLSRFYLSDVGAAYNAAAEIKLAYTSEEANPPDIIITDAYQNVNSVRRQYIFYCYLNTAIGESNYTYFRVVYEGDMIKIYPALDTGYYFSLKEGSGIEKVEASTLKSYEDTTQKAISDIKQGVGKWTELDTDAINMRLAMDDGEWLKNLAASPEVTNEAVPDETESSPEEDIADLE